jgi:pilus assembly protein CpaF
MLVHAFCMFLRSRCYAQSGRGKRGWWATPSTSVSHHRPGYGFPFRGTNRSVGGALRRCPQKWGPSRLKADGLPTVGGMPLHRAPLLPHASAPSASTSPAFSAPARAHAPSAPFLPGAAPPARRRASVVVEFEELAALVADATVTDVLVVGGVGTWVDRGTGLEAVQPRLTEARARELATRLVALGGRHVDETTPCADVRHGDGVRVHVVLAPVSVGGTAVSIRLPQVHRPTLATLERGGTFAFVPRSVVEDAVAARRNVLVTGATGSGKTTLLAAMLGNVPVDERIVTVEDVAELRIAHPHVVALEARQANAEGVGALGLDRLVREALRMRPDRIVVGECRGAEVRELLSALNTGHDGGAGTVHANGIADVAARLEALGALAGLGAEALARQAVSAFDLVLHVERRAGQRRLGGVGTLCVGPDGRLEVRPVDGLR